MKSTSKIINFNQQTKTMSKGTGLFFTLLLSAICAIMILMVTTDEPFYFKFIHLILAIVSLILANFIFNQSHKD